MSYNPFSLKGKIILITGAAGGIGRATSVECSKLGATLVLTDINEEGLNETFTLLEGEGHTMKVANLTDQKSLDELVEHLPQLNGFVSNAGIMKLTPIQFIKESEIERIHKINLVAPMLLLKCLLRAKKLHNGSSVVFTSSAAGVCRVSPANSIYSTAKSGLDAFMRSAALELGARGIRVNSVNPGIVETGLIKSGQMSEEELEREKKNYPLRRFAKPEEIALGIIYLLSDASSFITGTALKIDGGMTLS